MLDIDEIVVAPPEDSTGTGVELGVSREGRPIEGWRLGQGTRRVSLLGGCHADEPVGPWMLGRLTTYLRKLPSNSPWLRDYQWYLIPHLNPDGAERNRGWSETTVPVEDHAGVENRGFDLSAYLAGVVRELPGDDIEFGFPYDAGDLEARPENRGAAAFLAPGAPFALHATLHGMGFARGPWFLIDAFWRARTAALRDRLRDRVGAMGYLLHDVDRGGDKGFWRIAEGFTTRPDSRAMRDHFLAAGDPDSAALFRPSSMEFVRSLGGDPLTLVSEMPLFLLPSTGPLADPGLPRLERLQLLRAEREEASVRPMPISDQMRLQLELLSAGLAAVG